jgi:hypothetical protein
LAAPTLSKRAVVRALLAFEKSLPVLGCLFPVDGDHGGGSIVGMLCVHVPGRAGAELRWVASGNPGGVGDVAGDHVPHNVGDHKAKGTSNVVLWT